MGDEERIRLWEDLWWEDQPLGSQFLRLFKIVIVKNLPISFILGFTFPFSWNFNFLRNLSDFEIEELEKPMFSLALTPSVSNARAWSLSSLGLFIVKFFFLVLSHLSDSIPSFSTNFVWKSQVPFKVKSFAWLVTHKMVNTNHILQLRPYKAFSLDICKLCMEHGESVDHFFLYCP